MEQGEGNETSTELRRNANVSFRVRDLAQRPHGHRHGRIHVRASPQKIGRDDTHGVTGPCDAHAVLADPLARAERANDHEQRSDELVTKGLHVLAAFNERGRKGNEEAGGNKGHQVPAKGGHLFDDRFHHGILLCFYSIRDLREDVDCFFWPLARSVQAYGTLLGEIVSLIVHYITGYEKWSTIDLQGIV